MRVWKYTLRIVDLQTLQIPIGARFLSVQMQEGQPQIWALVDENAQLEPRSLAIYCTGQPIWNNPGLFIGTFQVGAFVFHVFEEEK